MRLVEEHLATSNPDRISNGCTRSTFFRARSYLTDRNISIFLVTITGVLLALGAVGVFGLARFSVGARTEQSASVAHWVRGASTS